MHLTSMIAVKKFRDAYLSNREAESLQIVDIGSMDIYGCYRPLFQAPAWHYVGVDLESGPNVDLVLRDPYRWTELETHSADVLISGQALEHMEFFWLAAQEMARIIKPGGLACLVAPSAGPIHRHPVDCWRIYPDGMRAIARYTGLECLEAYTLTDPVRDPGSDPWFDTVAVLRKPLS